MRIILVFLLLIGCSGSNETPVDFFAVETPRPFGYVLGDEVNQRIILVARPGVELQTKSLPSKGSINRWLNLNEITVKQEGRRYEIELRYQLFYAALEVKALKIPGFNLQLNEDGQVVTQAVPTWEFTMSPLRELSVRKTEHGEYMRPDVVASLLSNQRYLSGFYVSLLVSLSTAIYLAYLYGYFPKLMRRLLFKKALLQLSRLSIDQIDQALGLVHQAFNTLNRQPLFQNQLNDFYRRFPEYKSVNSELVWFFQYSNRYFFAKGFHAAEADLEKIKTFCSHCRQIERGSR